MFFNISNVKDSRFPNNYDYGFVVLNCDNGWNLYKFGNRDVWAKGYANHYNLTELASDVNLTDTGNYCLIDISTTVKLRHNINRGFPLNHKTNSLTNLFNDNEYQPIWLDDLVTIHNPWNLHIEKTYIDTTVPDKILSRDQTVESLKKILIDDIGNFYTNNNYYPLLFCTGGVDTALLYSLFHETNSSFELIVDEYIDDSDYFWRNNKQFLTQYWGYNQIHYWATTQTCLATGSHGDEYMLRGPATIATLTAWHDIEFTKCIRPTDYHYWYFTKYQDIWHNSWRTRKELQAKYPTDTLLKQQIINVLLYDHQHWHLGNTLTWTLFKNIELAKTLLQCPIDQLIPQFTDAKITKQMINPKLLDSISYYKNLNNQENLVKLMEFHLSN